ncbi:HAD family hydrolase [uncultured Jatrophihabitans sp.]|uniref:HAD family hydrolase n=1 Tax=uncultured Jatrophihabitans sp. TaxID=1610747 RepID=UPI0035CA3C14
MAAVPAVHGVVFDIGETLFDRTREWAGWAAWFGTTPHTFSAVFGAVVAAGGGVDDVVQRFRPDSTYAQLRPEVDAAGLLPPLTESDLYPGARAALQQLRDNGLVIGVAGNQPAAIGGQIRDLALPVDWVAVSAELGVRKPAPAFFAECAERCGVGTDQLLYVGDQLDQDVTASLAAGCQAGRVRTGPWGRLQHDRDVEARCRVVVATIAQLADALAADTEF